MLFCILSSRAERVMINNDDNPSGAKNQHLKMENKLVLKDISNRGEEPLKDVKDVTYVYLSENADFQSNMKKPETTNKIIKERARHVSKEQKRGFERQLSKERNELMETNQTRVKNELTLILNDSKKLMFAVQLMKFSKCAEVPCNKEVYEILSITSPRAGSASSETNSCSLEIMIQKRRRGQITIHKAIVGIQIMEVKKLAIENDSLEFETHVKIDKLETHASITIYFALKTLGLIFGNLALFSSQLASNPQKFTCTVLFTEAYSQDARKKDYTTKYIVKSINFLIQEKRKGVETNEEKSSVSSQLNDHVNRLLMLGVTPCSIETMCGFVQSHPEDKVAEENIKPITSICKEQNIYQMECKSFANLKQN